MKALPLVLALATCACSRDAASASNSAAAQQRAPAGGQPVVDAPPKPVPAQLPDVIARVNGETIGRTDLEKAIKNVEGRAGQAVPVEERDRVYRGVLDQLIAYRLLTQETKTRNIDVAEAEVDARLAQIRQQFPSEDAFTHTLSQQNLSVEQLREDAKSDMRVAKMLEREVNASVAVRPQDVSTFYEQNPDKFKQGERVRASHILIRTPEKADAKAKQDARAKAAEVLEQVKRGKDFGELAKHYSQDPGSAATGGDLGYFAQGQMVGPFEQAAFALAPGAVSGLVETPFGFHIIKVADKQAPRVVPFDEVKPQIEELLENQQRQQKTEAFINALKARGKVEILI
ncbi:MAG: peptidylprolyl isomerase [Vicinamibacterales bacterium]